MSANWKARLRNRAAAAARGLVDRARPGRGMVSVVVPAYGVEDYIGACLDSLSAQAHDNVEIIVVDDGSLDASARIARERAVADPRIRVVTRPNGGLSAARNTGVEHAKGEFLAFIDADDTVADRVFSAPLEAMAESGSDFAVTRYDRLDKDENRAPGAPWILAAHRHRRIGVTLDECPEAMVNAVAWSKVYRRAFWDAAGLSFPIGRIYEDQPVSMEAFAKATAFDFLPNLGVHWRVRGDGSSISQAADSVRNIVDHNHAVRESLRVLRENGHRAAAGQRSVQLLANNMPFFVRHISAASDEYWDHLREGVTELVESIDRGTYFREVPALEKVLYELIVSGRRDDAAEIVEEHGRDVRRFPAEVADGRVRVVLPYTDRVSDDVRLLSEGQLKLAHKLTHVSWQADGRLRLGGWAHIANIDLAEHEQSLEITLVEVDGRRHPLEVQPGREPRADTTGQHDYCDYSPSGFTALLDPAGLPTGEHRFEVTVSAAGITRTTPLDQPAVLGSSGVAHSLVLADGRVLVAKQERRRQQGMAAVLVLQVRDDDTWARECRWSGDTLEVDFEASKPQQVHLAHIDRREPFVSAVPERNGSYWTARLDLSELGDQLAALGPAEKLRPLRFRVIGDNRSKPLLAPRCLAHSPGVPPEHPEAPHTLSRARTGELELFDWVPSALRHEVDDRVLRIEMAHTRPLERTPVLRSDTMVVEGKPVPGSSPTRSIVEFDLTHTVWGHEGLAIPTDKYLVGFLDEGVGATDGDESEAPAGWAPLVASADLLDRLPNDELGHLHRYRVNVLAAKAPSLMIEMTPPLTDDERGRRNQRRLHQESLLPRAEDDSVFFRSLYGEVTNCNALGVHRELRSRGSSLRLLWSVADRSVPVPEGGIGLVEGSRAWHEALARSRYHMVNVHQMAWFEKPAGQTLIQTMHGYPYKVMGHTWWRKAGFPPHQITSFDRRAREWDYFVSPAHYATPLLKEAFLDPAGADAEILEIGYPRNDVLVSAEAADIRRRTRAMLGVDEDATVVLHAPTFRDYLSADDTTAKRLDLLDAEELVAAHDDVVVLLRGHAFHARAKETRQSTDRIIDVTQHPDINDLILASDVGVLDYSSLRFDYGVADRPMIFLVPDRARYDQARGGLVPYEPTAPGPHVSTTEEVSAWVADLPRLVTEYAAERQQFREDFIELDDGHASARLVDAVFVPRGDAIVDPAQGSA